MFVGPNSPNVRVACAIFHLRSWNSRFSRRRRRIRCSDSLDFDRCSKTVWFWRLKPQRKQPWTTAAILLAHHGQEGCLEPLLQADTQTAASTVTEPVEAHQTVVRFVVNVDRLALEALGRVDRMHSHLSCRSCCK
jgi:hypothetical protein